jgi:hypothetical protein
VSTPRPASAACCSRPATSPAAASRGILVAFVAAGLPDVDAVLTTWTSAHDAVAAGPWSDALALLPFVALAALLAATGRRATAPAARRGSG